MSAVTTDVRPHERITALDGLRAIALTRVVVWHVTGWAAATWFIAAVPAMFAVSGALLARSYTSRPVPEVLWSRAKRLFPALWCYSAVVLVVSRFADAETSTIWTFFVPLAQPTSTLGGEWFTSALWYLQSYLWVVLLSPILWWTSRRLGTAAVAIGAFFTTVASLTGFDSGTTSWQAGDVVLYSTCAVAGMVWLKDGIPSSSKLMRACVVSAFLVAAWLLVRPSSDLVVNNDHTLHLLVGAFWSATLLAAPQWLASCARTRWARLVNARSLTVYLWHSSIAWLAWQLTPAAFTGLIRTFVVLIATFAAIPVVTATVGLVEKRDSAWRTPLSLSTRAVVVISVVAGLVSPTVATRINLASPPGDQPLPPSAAPEIETIPVSGEVRRRSQPRDATGTDWLEREQAMYELLVDTDAEMKLGGTRALVVDPDGRTWFGRTDNARNWPEPSLVGSLTKTFTTSLVMRLVERGVLDLDAPVGDLSLSFRHREVTLRQLMSHTAGIPEMSRSKDLASDGITPAEIIQWLNERPLRFRPGSRIEYSTTGFAVVGVVIEQATGRQFEDMVESEFGQPLGYSLDYFRGRYKSIGYSTGGIIMNMADLADWIRRYAGERTVTSRPWPWNIKNTTGLGIHGYCPCEDGEFTALGHMGGRTFATVDADGYVVIIDTRGILVLDNYRRTQQFAQELRLLAGGGRTLKPGD